MNKIPDLPIECEPGYLKAGESLVFYPIPGSRVIREYMDGTTDQVLNIEFAMQSTVQSRVNGALWIISDSLEKLEELESQDGSFDFESITIPNKPFINNADDKGFFTFLLDIQANITVYKEDK